MKKSRAIFWFALWIVFISAGTIFSAVNEVLVFQQNGYFKETPPYSDYQIFLLLVYLPLCLVPMLSMACYYATKEKNRIIKICSVCALVHHVICVTAVLLQVL